MKRVDASPFRLALIVITIICSIRYPVPPGWYFFVAISLALEIVLFMNTDQPVEAVTDDRVTTPIVDQNLADVSIDKSTGTITITKPGLILTIGPDNHVEITGGK
jgi:hypothetical protein